MTPSLTQLVHVHTLADEGPVFTMLRKMKGADGTCRFGHQAFKCLLHTTVISHVTTQLSIFDFAASAQ